MRLADIAVQVWLFFCALLLMWAYAAGVQAEDLRPVAWLLSIVSGVGLLVDGLTFIVERIP